MPILCSFHENPSCFFQKRLRSMVAKGPRRPLYASPRSGQRRDSDPVDIGSIGRAELDARPGLRRIAAAIPIGLFLARDANGVGACLQDHGHRHFPPLLALKLCGALTSIGLPPFTEMPAIRASGSGL